MSRYRRYDGGDPLKRRLVRAGYMPCRLVELLMDETTIPKS